MRILPAIWEYRASAVTLNWTHWPRPIYHPTFASNSYQEPSCWCTEQKNLKIYLHELVEVDFTGSAALGLQLSDPYNIQQCLQWALCDTWQTRGMNALSISSVIQDSTGWLVSTSASAWCVPPRLGSSLPLQTMTCIAPVTRTAVDMLCAEPILVIC